MVSHGREPEDSAPVRAVPEMRGGEMAKHGCRGSRGSAAKEQFMVCGQQSRDSSKGGMSTSSKQ